MDKSNLVTLAIAVMSLLAALSSQRQSAKASKGTNDTALITSKTDAETEAYMRARAMDTETINRQAAEIKEMRSELTDLRKAHDHLEDKCEDLEDQNRRLRERVVDLEKHERKL